MDIATETAILASASCGAFCLVILMVVVVLYRKDPLCCRFRPDRTQNYMVRSDSLDVVKSKSANDDFPHYNSRHSLVGISHNGHQRSMGTHLPGELFIIGKPSDYHMDGPLPRLPSYESVRKKDRQRQIHSMIAQRFGLGGSHDEPPPTYEETLCHSVQISPADIHVQLDVDLSVNLYDDNSHPSEDASNTGEGCTRLQGSASSLHPSERPRYLSI